MVRDVKGAHALVTGGGRGIGRAIALALTEAGARATVLGREESRLKAAVKAGDAAAYVVADITNEAEVARACGQAMARFGPIDILVNNAGGADTAAFGKTDIELVRRMLELNLVSAFVFVRLLLPAMIERGFGRIINVASTAALKGYPYASAYCAAKHGLVGMTRALAVEIAKTGVTANAVCPGYTDTDLVRTAVADIASRTGRPEAEVRAELVAGNPQQRLVAPHEIAAAVVYLAGANAAAVNGATLSLSGGEVG
ncbi:MAG: SDR family NAD(P)-dependent oxidoreductase [Hyphomicrobiaceae bacterium]|nr:MAG: SDR family NAD(P)-dependent oxidoreductase [Hyphomicrobiaceae bacterium]